MVFRDGENDNISPDDVVFYSDESDEEFPDEPEYNRGNLDEDPVKGLQDEIEQKKDELYALMAEIEDNSSMLKALNTEIEDANSKLESLMEEIEKLDSLKSGFDEQKETLDKKSIELEIKEKDIAYRERKVSVKSKQVEMKTEYCSELEEKLREREEQLSEKEISCRTNESELNDLSANLEVREKMVKSLEEAVNQKMKDALMKENELMSRESVLNERELSHVEMLAAEKIKFEKELQEEKQQMLDTLYKDMAAMRKNSYDEINRENEEYVRNLSARESDLKKQIKQLESEKDDFAFEKAQIQAQKRKNDSDRRRIETLVQQKIDFESSRMDSERQSWERQREELYSQINDYERKMRKFGRIIERFGDDPQAIDDALRGKQDRINALEETIMNFDESKVQEYDAKVNEYDQLKSQCENYKTRYHELQSQISETDDLRFEYERLLLNKSSLENKVENLNNEINNYKETIKRLSTAVDPADKDARIAEIKKGILPTLTPEMIEKSINGQPKSEIEWLKNIENRCKDYGIEFPRRILYAFHTALKISDWSTITVLAGVSGTGKSELPRLYSQFGGILFINVPVQPNWDSKESMLGYFNSIDNRFEAQEVLRFLAQCTDLSGYGNIMAVVLLDEMNLAHVELYFAEFLSKLEERRGKSRGDVPEIEVKLGSGMEPYHVKMSRNILWTGTMNQDETTNSLSDKVLDRGIVINFPRPTDLISRKEMKKIDTIDSEPLLQQRTWSKWLTRKIRFEGKQADLINEYKDIVNGINCQLEKVGRALGHRVWQSIEYYIANYPTVIEEMRKIEDGEVSANFRFSVKIAFEDQIVQKIMPKLRGIETSGIGGEVLDEIISLLKGAGFDTLEEDFQSAMKLGYGQFIWNSAKYIEKTDDYFENYDNEHEAFNADSSETE